MGTLRERVDQRFFISSEMDLSPEQQEVSDPLSPAAGRMMQRQLKEGEREAPRETEVADGTQRPEARKMSHLTVTQVPSGPRRSASITCRDRWREENRGSGDVKHRACFNIAPFKEKISSNKGG